LHGTVDFSTMILCPVATLAIVRVATSMYPTSGAAPLPIPPVLVGVFTQTKIRSALSIAASTSVEKNRLGRRFSGIAPGGLDGVAAGVRNAAAVSSRVRLFCTGLWPSRTILTISFRCGSKIGR
jgi:hypothetical protein